MDQNEGQNEQNEEQKDIDQNEVVVASVDEELITHPKVHVFPSIRLLVYVMSNIVVGLVDANYMALHFAWVCMTNSTNIEDSRNNITTVTPMHDIQQLNWDRNTQRFVFMGFPIGGLLFVVLSGWLIDHLGARMVGFMTLFMAAIINAILPSCAFVSSSVVFVLRILMGTSSLLKIWRLCHINRIGAVVSAPFSVAYAMQCTYWGWPSVFYSLSVYGTIVSFTWLAIFRSEPNQQPCISLNEKNYILQNRPKTKKEGAAHTTPWKSLLYSRAVWATASTWFFNRACTTLVFMFMPTFFAEVLHIDVEGNGLMSATPFLAMFIGRTISGPLSDSSYCSGMSKTVSVKVFTTVGMLCVAVSSGLMAVTMQEDMHPPLSVILLCMIMLGGGICTAGFMKSPVLISPHHCGVIAALSNMAGYMSAIAVPSVVTAIVSQGSIDEWRLVFLVVSAMALVGCTIFFFFGSGQVQPWDEDKPDEPSAPLLSVSTSSSLLPNVPTTS